MSTGSTLRFAKPLVLVTEDGDARPALARAIGLVGAGNAAITVLIVSETVPRDAMSTIAPTVRAELEAVLRERRESTVRSLERLAADAGVELRIERREGSPFLVAIRDAMRGGHDLVLKTAGDAAEAKRTFGVTDKHLLRKCPCAVWLVGPDAPDKHRRIVAAVAVASLDGAVVDVVHAWSLFGESILRGPQTSISDPEVDHLVGSELNRRAQRLDRLIEAVPARGVELRRQLLRGRPAEAIGAHLRSSDASLLVMGTVGRSGIPGLLIGNTAERVVDEAQCSLLALKPAGFVSPVAPEG